MVRAPIAAGGKTLRIAPVWPSVLAQVNDQPLCRTGLTYGPRFALQKDSSSEGQHVVDGCCTPHLGLMYCSNMSKDMQQSSAVNGSWYVNPHAEQRGIGTTDWNGSYVLQTACPMMCCMYAT